MSGSRANSVAGKGTGDDNLDEAMRLLEAVQRANKKQADVAAKIREITDAIDALKLELAARR